MGLEFFFKAVFENYVNSFSSYSYHKGCKCSPQEFLIHLSGTALNSFNGKQVPIRLNIKGKISEAEVKNGLELLINIVDPGRNSCDCQRFALPFDGDKQ